MVGLDVVEPIHGEYMIQVLLSTLVIAGNPAAAKFESDQLQIAVSVSAQIYTWTITNNSSHPVMRVQFGQHQLYNHLVPPDWNMQVKEDHFLAWTDQVLYAIRPGQSRTITARVGSAGAILGQGPAQVDFGGVREPVRFEGVWRPVPEPFSKIVVIALTLIVIAVVHTFLVTRSSRLACATADCGS